MSFFNPNSEGIGPGVIEGNALAGMRHRVAVCVERVLDSCMKQDTKKHTPLHVSDFTPPNPTLPLKFISAQSLCPEAVISDLLISRLAERQDFARVKCTITIPLQLTIEDSGGAKYFAKSKLSIDEDVILYVPRSSAFPFEIKAVAAVSCTEGKTSGDNDFIVTACYTIITKVTANTDLLIPTYGFCHTPRAVDFNQEECNEFFDLPLYPSGK